MLSMNLIGLLIICAQLCSSYALQIGREKTMVLSPFVEGRALKIISGITNLDQNIVKNVAVAASLGGASHVDIACDADLVRSVKSITSIPICVSSITPSEFVAAVQAGADMVEIGNFDGFYDCGMKFTAEEVLQMAQETRSLLPSTPLSVTIPHTLTVEEQITLAKLLEEAGADIIQTEGKIANVEHRIKISGIMELMQMAAPALASSYALSRSVNIPVIAASGMTDVTAPLALAAGAKGVGIGSMVNKLRKQEDMIMAVCAISKAMGRKVPSLQEAPQLVKMDDSSATNLWNFMLQST